MNPYDVLGVATDATRKEIKARYKKLAIENHPDKGGDEATFQRIKDAYETLSNTESREYFDTHGHGPKPGGQNEQGRVIGKIMNHVQNWLQAPPNAVDANLINHIERCLNGELEALNIEREKAIAGRKRIDHARDKMISAPDDIIGSFFDTKIQEIDDFHIKADVENELLDQALILISDYSWEEILALPGSGYGSINIGVDGWVTL